MLERITRRERFKLRLAETHKQLIEVRALGLSCVSLNS